MIFHCLNLFLSFHSGNQKPGDNDDALAYLSEITRTNNIQSQCRAYLDARTYRPISLDYGEEADVLELYAPVGSSSIQRIIDGYEDLDTIRLQRPAPEILPIVITRISNDIDSFIAPSDTLNIDLLLSRPPSYQLEAVLCEINKRPMIFMKNLTTNNWYYYQNNFTCEQFSDDLSNSLNDIIESTSTSEQRRLIKSAHFLVSMIFYNATKYIYKQQAD